jgi:hypothetical protein
VSVAEIPLTRGLVAIVDAEDAAQVLDMGRWYADVKPHTTYAAKGIRRGGPGGGPQDTVYMHQVIAGARLVDHINSDGLDNRRVNLRPATNRQNQQNTRRRSDNTSGYKGVHWHALRGRWRAEITTDSRRIHLGLFDDPIQAARAYDEAANRYFGEFARVNFPGVLR